MTATKVIALVDVVASEKVVVEVTTHQILCMLNEHKCEYRASNIGC